MDQYSYLSDRENFVSCNQTHEPLLNLNIGVPKGAILGTLLFLIYIHDIVNSSNILSFVFFADDTTVYVQHYSIDGAIQILNSELAKVAEWFDSNKLTLNVNKTHMLMMSRKKVLIRGSREEIRGSSATENFSVLISTLRL